MARRNARNYELVCQECEIEFKGLRPKDRFCSAKCRWRNRDKQPHKIAYQKEQNKKWRSWNFDYRRDYMLRYTYGISQEQYEELLASQEGCCAVCGKTPEEEGKNLAVDHDHATGEIYGILCTLCNKNLIGRIREPAAFRRAAEYLEEGTGLFVPKKNRKRTNRGKNKTT
jgi:hypothetical protein